MRYYARGVAVASGRRRCWNPPRIVRYSCKSLSLLLPLQLRRVLPLTVFSPYWPIFMFHFYPITFVFVFFLPCQLKIVFKNIFISTSILLYDSIEVHKNVWGIWSKIITAGSGRHYNTFKINTNKFMNRGGCREWVDFRWIHDMCL